jgi:ATP-binding cassette subfamily C protein CydD
MHVLDAASGRGKTSLLTWLAGFSNACEGIAELSSNCKALNLPDCAVLLDQALLHLPQLSSAENLELATPAVSGSPLNLVSNTSFWKYVEMYASDFAVSNCINRPMKTLSRGEIQRILAIRVLMHQAPVYLLDEPCAHIDCNTGQKIMKAFAAKAEAGSIVLIASLGHELEPLEGIKHTVWKL